ncbi:hypothetical protein [Lacipirellula limnantheis]|uniref:Uncharacterized protein n=1 Tax=Lacipirellula limnantheis TaxID=2528024 RepID=A0A517TYH5_9BACT|nr:hypothetical protein [Lacipirellula limnantheis]QDT73426.1 hypothetical protein I41_26150 [Lacipirellula limnantheis]
MKSLNIITLCILGSLFAAASTATSVHADRLDEELLNQMPKLIQACTERGYKNVATLTFLYQRGAAPSTFRGVAICNNMPERLENALALKLKSSEPELTILPGATAAASKEISGASYRTERDRQRLMDLQLMPAWGEAIKTKPDAYLIGKVKASDDLREITVSLGAFDQDSMSDLLEFQVKTDRYILADIGQGFSLSKGRLRGVSDDAIFDAVEEDETSDPSDEGDVDEKTSDEFPVELAVFYDDEPQEMSTDDEATGESNKELPEPDAGQNLTFGLTNTTDKPLAAVLLVNGVSTLYEEEGEAKELSKWVLEPGKEYRVKGYHQKGNEKYFEITTLTEDESVEKYEDLGGKDFAGLIHLYVFRTVDPAVAEVPKYTRSIGRLTKSQLRGSDFSTLRDLQQAIAKKSELFPPGTRPLAGWGREKNESLKEKELGDLTLTDTMIVRYSKTQP